MLDLAKSTTINRCGQGRDGARLRRAINKRSLGAALIPAIALIFSGGMTAAGTDEQAAGKQSAGDQVATATIETTLATDGDQIRQFAFDGDDTTCFVSQDKPGPDDHFTLVFDVPVAVTSISVTSGRSEGDARIEEGDVELSADGESFEAVAAFKDGSASARLENRSVRAVRLKPSGKQDHSVAIREVTIDSQPPVTKFRYPVEFVIDVSDAPEMGAWAEKTAGICQRAYPMINEELRSEAFRPPHLIKMTLKDDYRGVAAASGARIVGSVRFFKEHPDDVGAMVHETTHVAQHYRGRGNPNWLVEGVCDYVRFFKFEPGKLGPIDPQRAHYNGSYRVTAAFLAYLVDKYDGEIVRKLNALMREGRYQDDTFQTLTGKTLDQLDEEWRSTLK
jgi:hypothetical protein